MTSSKSKTLSSKECDSSDSEEDEEDSEERADLELCFEFLDRFLFFSSLDLLSEEDDCEDSLLPDLDHDWDPDSLDDSSEDSFVSL